MDVYFARMKELGKSDNVSARMQLMLQDVIELRERNWGSCDAVVARATIAAVHEAVRWIDIFSQSYFIDADVTDCQGYNSCGEGVLQLSGKHVSQWFSTRRRAQSRVWP
ncbi:hypothetical protein M405DRAFT_355671 [Rhizopogon salebrosus TDB-379]|nr:hypothetical protein M405DRAFT_355671 [Rhizopogon salebrosus TDB-379]